jgi:hypothetical protein
MTTPTTITSSVFALASILISISIMLILCFNLSNPGQLIIAETFSDLKPFSKAAMLYPLLQLLRKILFSLIVIYLGAYPFVQVFLLIFSSLSMTAYMISFTPFSENATLEVLNELTIWAAGMHMPIFMIETGFENEAGWSLVGVIALNIGGNISVMIIKMVRVVRKSYVRCR